MGAVASSPLEPGLKEILGLSLRRAPEFYERSDDIGNVPHAGALRTTLDDLGASAVFCVEDVPTVVLLSVEEYDPLEVARLHAALWNQGLASLLIVVSGETVRIFSLARIPRRDDDDDEFRSRCLVEVLNTVSDALALGNLLYSAESGRLWQEHRDYFRPEERVDRVLLNNLMESHRLLGEEDLPVDAAQALLVQAMFVAYLEDREIIGQEYFLAATNARATDFETTLAGGDVESVEQLFATLRKDFNGDLFVAPCSFEVEGCGPVLEASHLTILARFRSGREEMRGSGGQYRIWPYNFKYIPVELISAVYDQFLSKGEPGARRERGAYYTPMLLADVVVSQVWSRLPADVKENGRFMDPACGSGIFLVRLFQRLCDHRRAVRCASRISWDELVGIARNLRGWDLDGGAVRVAVFSLYVALLEEVTPPDIRRLMKRGRMLPELHEETIRHGDFFSVLPEEAPADVVCGNPPWSSRRGESYSSLEWCRRELLPAPSREQAWPFVWKSLRHLRNDGVVAFLLPAMAFLHNHSGQAVKARKRLMRKARLFTVVNFADMRFQLFDHAVRPAALLLFGRAAPEGTDYRFEYLTPKADLNLKSRSLITLGSTDRCLLDSRVAEADPSIFKKRLRMSEPEARLFNYLSQFPCLGDLVVQFGSFSHQKRLAQDQWMIGQGFKPSRAERRSDTTYHEEHSGVVAKSPYLPIKKFRGLARSDEGLRPWKDGMVHRRGFEAGFKGPRVVIPQGVAIIGGGERLRAAYVERPMTFQHVIQAVVVPRGDERRGMLLAGLLNSRLMLWFAFHGTSSFGADRPKVQQTELLRLPFPEPDHLPDRERARSAADGLVDVIEGRLRSIGAPVGIESREQDVLEEIDRLAYEFFCLSEEERIVIDETVDYVIPAVQPHRSSFPLLWQRSSSSDRRAYARTLVDNLESWFDGDCNIGIRLLARNDDLAVLRLSLRDGRGLFKYDEDDDASVGAALAGLAERVPESLPGSFQSTPDFRVFVDRDLYLVKPAGKRFWLRSAALADAGAIALDLHTFAGNRHDVGPRRR